MGLEDVHLTWEETLDPQACNTNPTDYHTFSRDPARTPFPWNAQKNAGYNLYLLITVIYKFIN